MIAPPRFQHVSSGSLALAIHGLFMVALVLSMSWKNLPHLPVEADLWAALPEPPPVEPPPLPESTPEPRPDPPPSAAKSQASEADIALKKAEQENKRLAEEELRKRDEARKLEEKRLAEEKARQAQEEQAEKERIEQIKKKELERRQVEQEMARQAQADLEREARAMQEQAARRDRVIDDFKRRIQIKVQSYVRLPQRITGDPEAVFQVTLFANGEVRNVSLVKSSGQPAYDVEVERAILKASPLPLPNEKDAAAVFRSGLVLKFRPN